MIQSSFSYLLIRNSFLLVTTFLLSHFSFEVLRAQTLPINHFQEEQIRLQQLLHGSKHSSLTLRPVWLGVYEKYMNEADQHYGIWTDNHIFEPFNTTQHSWLRFGIYEPVFTATSNSKIPYGENNEAAWYGRGLNTEISGGFWVTSDFITLTFRPQFSTSQNRDFEVPRFIPADENGHNLYAAEGVGNMIDNPFRFGSDPFTLYSHGYSSIRIHFRQIESGFSTEPLSWGGNVNYPLLLSNNAPGMKHFFFGTRAPVKIPYIGNFEFSYLAAFPEDSEYFIWNEDEVPQDRFMNGVNISYSPFFAPNLHLGFARAIHTYIDDDGLKSGDFGMIFDPFYLKEFIKTRGPIESLKPRNHLNSVYARWIWPESHFELYGEFYRQDFAWDSRDLLMEPRHNSGYAFGIQNLFFAPYALFYRVNLEFTNMTPSYLQEVRRQDYYYTHPVIRQGHTNRGQVLGAAIGSGSNSQLISIDAYKEWGRYGIFFRRLADNNHFHYRFDRSLNRPEIFRQGYGDYWRNRTDLTIGTRAFVNYRKLLISGEFSWTKLFNYGRYDYGRFGGLNIANFEPYDISNIQFQMSVSYQF